MVVVHYFGGYRAGVADVEAWRNSAAQQCPTVKWFANPYPNGASASDPLAYWFRSAVMAQRIKDSPDQHILIGHSSGCKISNDVAEHARRLNARNWTLIALDGFVPSLPLLAAEDTMVWSAKCGSTTSLNYSSCSRAGPRFHVYEAGCDKLWPLHFSLVNVNASDEYPLLGQGYHDCIANLVVFGDNLEVPATS